MPEKSCKKNNYGFILKDKSIRRGKYRPMKKIVIPLLIMLLVTLLSVSCDDKANESKADAYRIGDTGPAGGTVFYVNPDYVKGSTDEDTNWHYLEAAPEDLPGSYSWGPDGSFGTEDGVGKGKKNTRTLINAEGTFPAAEACVAYKGGKYTDWFLPSIAEVRLLYSRLFEEDMGGIWGREYLSSSECTDHLAKAKCFFIDGEDYHHREAACNVRPVRAFE